MEKIKGKYYVTDRCVGCNICTGIAPNNFKIPEESYKAVAYKQPINEQEENQCKEALKSCCIWAIRDNGMIEWKELEYEKNENEWKCKLVSPEQLCFESDWDLDSNTFIFIVYRAGSTLPRFEEVLTSWQFRRENLLKFFKDAPLKKSEIVFRIQIYSKDLYFYSLIDFSKNQQKVSFADDEAYQIKNKAKENNVSEVFWLNKNVGVSAFSAVMSYDYYRAISTSKKVIVIDHNKLICPDIKISASVTIDQISILQLTQNFKTGDHSTNSIIETARDVFKKIFASYAKEDNSIVKAIDSIFKAFGFGELIWNEKILNVGDNFSKIYQAIADSNSFQLFWSKYAAKSKQVLNELEYALSLNIDGFIKPIYWEEPLNDIPEKLSNIFFAKIEIAKFNYTATQISNLNVENIQTLSIISNYTTMGDQYNVNQAGAVGPNSSASNNTFNQFSTSLPENTNYERLTRELYELKQFLLSKASSPEQYVAIGELAKAEEGSKSKDGNKVIKSLLAAGKWVLDGAKEITTDVLAEVIKKQIGV